VSRIKLLNQNTKHQLKQAMGP